MYVKCVCMSVCVKMENCNYACCAAFIHCVFVFILYKFPFHHFYIIHPSISTHFFHPSFLYTIHPCTWHLFPFRFIQTYSHIPVSSACKKERFTSWQTMNGLIFTFIYKSHRWHSNSVSWKRTEILALFPIRSRNNLFSEPFFFAFRLRHLVIWCSDLKSTNRKSTEIMVIFSG